MNLRYRADLDQAEHAALFGATSAPGMNDALFLPVWPR
jgi:hypothetical protein